MTIEIVLASEKGRYQDKENSNEGPSSLVTPGDVITKEKGYMRGHGTYSCTSEEVLKASVPGLVTHVNKLISVIPLKTKYSGEIGDVVVGRIISVQQKRWRVETNSRLDSLLPLSSVDLPGGEHRRRSSKDELTMRHYLKEGDLISAEVQNLFREGSLSLQTRSVKYGKLSVGTLVIVSPSLIKRQKTHFHSLLSLGLEVILGNNGYIWISPSSSSTSTQFAPESGGDPSLHYGLVDKETRAGISRVRNVIGILASKSLLIWDTSILTAYEISNAFSIKDLLKHSVMEEIAKQTALRLESSYSTSLN